MLVLKSAAPLRIDRNFEIPSIPLLLIRILQELNDDAESSNKLEELILHDPALSARILRLANSAYYSFGSEVKTISHAIVLLGTGLVKSLAIGVTIFDCFTKGMKCEAALINELWTHSFGVGLLAQDIWTRRSDRKEGEFAFLCGLLHDLGMVVFFKNYPTHYCFLFANEKSETDSDISAWELDYYGADHAAIGAMLAKQWDFPSELTAVLGKHHHALDSGSALVCAVSISDMLAKQTNTGYDGDDKIAVDISKLQACLRMSEEEYESLRSFADLSCPQTEAFFR